MLHKKEETSSFMLLKEGWLRMSSTLPVVAIWPPPVRHPVSLSCASQDYLQLPVANYLLVEDAVKNMGIQRADLIVKSSDRRDCRMLVGSSLEE